MVTQGEPSNPSGAERGRCKVVRAFKDKDARAKRPQWRDQMILSKDVEKKTVRETVPRDPWRRAMWQRDGHEKKTQSRKRGGRETLGNACEQRPPGGSREIENRWKGESQSAIRESRREKTIKKKLLKNRVKSTEQKKKRKRRTTRLAPISGKGRTSIRTNRELAYCRKSSSPQQRVIKLPNN